MEAIRAGLPANTEIELWWQDEARVGQKNKITRRWAPRGTRPRAPRDQRTKSAYIFADQAGWHTTAKLVIPPNITLLLLPPRSPELNPVENIWQFIRDNWLSNRVFKSYDDIVALCCEAWNKLIDQPWTIMSIGQRKWAHGF